MTVGRMSKEELRKHLRDEALVTAIQAVRSAIECRKRIGNARLLLTELEIQAGKEELEASYNKFNDIVTGYDNLISDIFGLCWQNRIIVEAHMDKTEAELEALPEWVSN